MFIRHRRWVIGLILLLAVMLFNAPTNPPNGLVVYDTEVNFDWIGQASYALVDDNDKFTSPIVVNKGGILELVPGEYYWMVSGLGVINKFEVKSLLTVDVKSKDEGDSVGNTGNVDTKIDIKESGMLTGSFALKVGETRMLKRTDEKNRKVIGSLFEE
tara:strand:+ start:2623 stop:3096 length:474 start_codon:yes stop_codon:yes gene_type:complete